MRSRTWKLVRFIAPVGLIPLFACLAPPVESPTTTVTQETNVRVAQDVKNQVDLLFVIDNSLSMQPKQTELRNRIPQLITALQNFAAMGSPASYHIGVVTSDLGAGPMAVAGCNPGGDGGKLQIAPADGCKTDPGCAALIPAACSNFALGGGVRFIDYNQLNNTNNIMGGLDVATAFTCMAMTGQKGCGLEHQLEASYRALHDNVPENQGFLRPDAILAVVYVTDEDDCSASPQTDLFFNDATSTQKYGPLDSFRCTQWGIECNGALVPPMSTPTPFTGCVSAPNPMDQGPGKLIDISKYINFFTKPASQGGVKVDPNDVILVSISAPQDPVGVSITNMNCPAPATSCPILNHSCVAASNNAFFGDPAVRINTVIRSAKHSNVTSICDTDYTSAINALGQLIISQIGVGCLNAPVANRTDAAGNLVPDCSVEDVTSNPDGTTTITEIPSCAENGHKTPCWQLDSKLSDYNMGGCYQSPIPTSCKLPSTCQPVVQAVHIKDNPTPTCAGTGMPADASVCELTSVSIDRGGAMPPARTTARVSCATIASSTK